MGCGIYNGGVAWLCLVNWQLATTQVSLISQVRCSAGTLEGAARRPGLASPLTSGRHLYRAPDSGTTARGLVIPPGLTCPEALANARFQLARLHPSGGKQ
jgi:hypothetical protein